MKDNQSIYIKSMIILFMNSLLLGMDFYFGCRFLQNTTDFVLKIFGAYILAKVFIKVFESVVTHSFKPGNNYFYLMTGVIKFISIASGLALLIDMYDRRVFDVYCLLMLYLMLKFAVIYSIRMVTYRIVEEIMLDFNEDTSGN